MSLLLSVAILLAAVDTVVTWGRLRLHPALELNPLVRWLTLRLGTLWASILGVLIIQSGVAYLLLQLSPVALELLVGASLYRTYTQALSLRYF